jgi:hypothetical protein
LTSDQITVPPRAGIPSEEPIAGQRYRIDKRKQTPLPDMPMRSTSRVKEAWKRVRGEDGSFNDYHCPRCKTGIVRYQRVRGNLSPVAECDNQDCTWTLSQMTSAERADLAARDPEALRIAKHVANITGKERRMRKFLSKCAYGGL